MKLTKKLLTIIAPAALLTTVAPIAITSCNNDGKSANTITLVTTQKEWKNPTNNQITIEFSLAKELSSEQELNGPTFSSVEIHKSNADFDGDATWNVTGKKAVATMKFKHTKSLDGYITVSKMNFNIQNKTTKEVISKATFEGLNVTWTAQN